MTTADEYKAEGNKYFAAKEFEKAIEAFTKAIEHHLNQSMFFIQIVLDLMPL